MPVPFGHCGGGADPLWLFPLHEEKVRLVAFGRDLGQMSLIDPVGIGNDPAMGGLPEHLSQPDYWDDQALDDVAEHHARSHRGKLINIADQQQTSFGRQSPEKIGHQRDVHHGGFVDDQEVAVQWLALVPTIGAGGGPEFQQPTAAGKSSLPRPLPSQAGGLTAGSVDGFDMGILVPGTRPNSSDPAGLQLGFLSYMF